MTLQHSQHRLSSREASFGAAVGLWWNLWLVNFDGGSRERTLLSRVTDVITDHHPDVVCLQEVVTLDGCPSNAVADLLSELDYVSYFSIVSHYQDGRCLGNVVAVRREHLHEYRSLSCGVYGRRETPLQIVTLQGAHAGITFGNTHWLMMRPIFELHRWKQMRRTMKYIDELSARGVVVLWGGDLNTAKHHPYMSVLTRRYSLVSQPGATWWYGGRPAWLRASLDHVFATRKLAATMEHLDPEPSDHAPVLVRVGKP